MQTFHMRVERFSEMFIRISTPDCIKPSGVSSQAATRTVVVTSPNNSFRQDQKKTECTYDYQLSSLCCKIGRLRQFAFFIFFFFFVLHYFPAFFAKERLSFAVRVLGICHIYKLC